MIYQLVKARVSHDPFLLSQPHNEQKTCDLFTIMTPRRNGERSSLANTPTLAKVSTQL
jgi:hypothetical protein